MSRWVDTTTRSNKDVLAVPCPMCNAPRGRHCKNRYGERYKDDRVHSDRATRYAAKKTSDGQALAGIKQKL